MLHATVQALRVRAIAHALLGRGDCASTPPHKKKLPDSVPSDALVFRESAAMKSQVFFALLNLLKPHGFGSYMGTATLCRGTASSETVSKSLLSPFPPFFTTRISFQTRSQTSSDLLEHSDSG